MIARLPRRDEAGFTAVELVITSLLLSIITAAVLSVLVSQTKAERRTSAVVNSQEDVRVALTTIVRDLRSADPMLSPATVDAGAYQVDLQLNDKNGNLVTIRWTLDKVNQQLLRQTLSAPGGTVTGTTYRLSRIHNGDGTGTPVFTYFNSLGAQMTASNSTANDLANCSIRVHISLTADTNPGPAPFTLESDAELRNRLPGGVGC